MFNCYLCSLELFDRQFIDLLFFIEITGSLLVSFGGVLCIVLCTFEEANSSSSRYRLVSASKDLLLVP